MRILLGAAAAALLLASPALAQTGAPLPNCADFPAAPALPDGASANRQAMERGNEALQAWVEAFDAKATRCETDLSPYIELVRTLNESKGRRNTIVTSWAAEVEEFNARPATAERRQRGGVITRPDE